MRSLGARWVPERSGRNAVAQIPYGSGLDEEWWVLYRTQEGRQVGKDHDAV